MSKKRIDSIRNKIDKLNQQLLSLLNQRAEQVIEMGKVKHRLDLEVFDPKRERDIYVDIAKNNPGPLHVDAIVRIFEQIIAESKQLERIETYEQDE